MKSSVSRGLAVALSLTASVLLAEGVEPIARWSFEDDGDIGKDSVGTRHLSIAKTGGATTGQAADGWVGKAVMLRKGTTVANALISEAGALPTGTGPFSVSVWIRPKSDSAENAYLLVNRTVGGGIPNGWTGASWDGWNVRFYSSKLAIDFQNGWRGPVDDAQCLMRALPDGNVYKDGQWHHLVVTRDADSKVCLYWDGCLLGSKVITKNANIPATVRFTIGGQDSGNSFSGDYDEIACYDVALSEADVLREYFAKNPDFRIDDAGQIVLEAAAGTVVTNLISYGAGSKIAKYGEGTVALYHSSGNYRGSVGVTNGLLRTAENGTFKSASAFAVEKGATLELGRSSDYTAAFSGLGTTRLTGRGVFNLTGDLSGFLGTWSSYLATVDFGTAEKPVRPAAASSLVVENGGFLRFHDDVTVASLSGEGLLGGVSIPDGKTLTVDGAADAAFAGRLAGKGALVKNGAGSLALSGVSDFTRVEVNEGTLALDCAVSVPRRGFWRFEDANDLGADSSEKGVSPLAVVNGVDGTCYAEQVEGVVGKAVRIRVDDNYSGSFLMGGADADIPHGDSPYTFSAWVRPMETSSANAYVMRCTEFDATLDPNTGWNGTTGWMTGWYLKMHTNGSRLAITYSGWSETAGQDYSKAEGALPEGDYNDGRWHHVAFTMDGDHLLSLYWDGQLIGQNRVSAYWVSEKARLQLGSYELKPTHRFNAYIDEVQYIDGAWTAEQVAAEYRAKVPQNALAPLPEPLAHWTFDSFETDEHGRYFKDYGTAGWDFYEVKNGAKTVSCIGATDANGEDVNGGAAFVTSANKGAYLKVGDVVSPKATFGLANPAFTLSVRFRNCENTEWTRQVCLSFGSAQSAASCLRLTKESENEKQWYPYLYRILPGGANKNAGWLLEDTYASHGAKSPWTTFTFVNSAAAKTVTVYHDGRKVGTYVTAYSLDLDRILLFAGWNYVAYSGFAVDDMRVYKEQLSEAQVKALVYEQAGVKPAPLANATVTVAGGATLETKGGDHVAAAVTGAGNVAIDELASFGAHDWTGFTGSVTGAGYLALYKRLPAGLDVRSNVRVAGVVTDSRGAGLPLVNSTGRVQIAPTGVVRVTDVESVGQMIGLTFEIARAASFDAPANFSGWKVEPFSDELPPCRFTTRNGVFRLKILGSGSVLIVR